MTHLLSLLTSVNGFLAMTLGPMFCAGLVVCRVLARHMGDGWR